MRARLALASLVWIACSGCNTPGGAPFQAGHYEGSLIRRTSGGLNEITVQAEISQQDQQCWKVDVKTTSGTVVETPTVVDQSTGDISLTVPSLAMSGQILPIQQDCFVATAKTQTRLCQDSTHLLIEVRDAVGVVYSLSLTAFSVGTPLPPEIPANYSLDDAMKHTFNGSFETRAQFERAIEASHVASNAYWNLLPRLNINLGVSAAKSVTGGFLELLGAVGDLAPFLLPTRWIQASIAAKHSDAEKTGLLIMRGDTGAEVEALIYSWKKDGDILTDFVDIVAQAQHLADQLRSEEVYGQYPLGTADTIQTSINAMKMDQANLAAAWDDEKAALAQAMGFINPDAVLNITVSAQSDEPGLDHLDEVTLENQVLERALELTQINKLIEIAKSSQLATWFQWLDPSGDPNASLGAGLPSAISITGDHVDELNLQREKLESALRQKARQALDDYQTAQDQSLLSSQDRALQEKRLARTLELVNFGKDTNTVELVSVYQDLLRSIIIDRTAQASIQVARVKLNRLLLEGYYSQLAFVGPHP